MNPTLRISRKQNKALLIVLRSLPKDHFLGPQPYPNGVHSLTWTSLIRRSLLCIPSRHAPGRIQITDDGRDAISAYRRVGEAR